MERDKRISKALSKMLRHEALNENMKVSPNGYVPIEQLLAHKWFKSHKTTLQDIERIVSSNDKQRFKVRDGEICALQGHSMKLDALADDLTKLSPTELPHVIVHGTFKSKLIGIRESGGLSRMGRNHVHFASGVPSKFRDILPQYLTLGEDVISGMRGSCQVLIFLDVDKLRKSGLDVYKSGNGVILIPGNDHGVVSMELFNQVYDIDNGLIDIYKCT